MSYFKNVDAPTDETVKDIYKNMVEGGWSGSKENLPMNMFTYLGERPDLLAWYWDAAQKTLAGGNLPVTLKQMVGLSMAAHTKSAYCSHAHFRALEMLGVPDDIIHKCSTGHDLEDLPPVQRKVIQFAMKIADDSNSATPEDFKELETLGLNKQDILELIMFIALAHAMMIWTNVGKVPKDE